MELPKNFLFFRQAIISADNSGAMGVPLLVLLSVDELVERRFFDGGSFEPTHYVAEQG